MPPEPGPPRPTPAPGTRPPRGRLAVSWPRSSDPRHHDPLSCGDTRDRRTTFQPKVAERGETLRHRGPTSFQSLSGKVLGLVKVPLTRSAPFMNQTTVWPEKSLCQTRSGRASVL